MAFNRYWSPKELSFKTFKKTFKLKNLYDLFNHKDVKKDSDNNPHCKLMPYVEEEDYDHKFYLWTPNFKHKLLFHSEKPSYLTITEKGKNNTWSKCTITYLYSRTNFEKQEGYCGKNDKGNYHILIIPKYGENGFPSMGFDSAKLDIENMDFLEKYVFPNLGYLGLDKNDCLSLGGTKCISLNSGLTFESSAIRSNPSYRLRHLMLLTEFNEDDDLYFSYTEESTLPKILYAGIRILYNIYLIRINNKK